MLLMGLFKNRLALEIIDAQDNVNEPLFQFDLQLFAQDPDKTEEATPRRKSEARKKGQVPKSSELNSIVVLLALFVLLNALGKWFYSELVFYMRANLSPLQLTREVNEVNIGPILWQHCLFFARIFLPLGIGAMLIGVVMNLVQVGPLFTMEPLKPKFSRINPMSGFQKIFSTQGLVELIKAAVKLTVVSYFAYSTLKDRMLIMVQTVKQPPFEIALTVWSIIYQVAIKICTFLLILALFDYVYQRWEHNKSLRMSKKEIKDEFKQQEGNPEIKSKIRQRQRQMAARRMMQEVPKADVVITNPTHLAIALRYDAATMEAPTVVAMGEGFIAAKIKEVAAAHGVPLVENKPLAQALYKAVDIGEVVPAKLFQAVAEVLAFVYRLRQQRA